VIDLVIADKFDNFFKAFAIVAKLHDFVHDQMHFGAGGERVKNMHLAAGVIGHIFLTCDASGVIAAGEIAGDGDAENVLGICKGLVILTCAGAGGTGASLVCLKIGKHGIYVKVSVINIFSLIGNNLKRRALKWNAVKCTKISRGVGYNFEISHVLLLSKK
jgi:hypothetical protein